jgi:hypothetical protein
MKPTLSATLLTVALALPLAATAANVELSLTPQDSEMFPGQTSFIDLIASYDGTDLLLGGAASLTYDASILEVMGVTLHAPSDVAGTSGTVSVSGDVGTISTIGFATFVGVSGAFTLATIEFQALSPGVSVLTPFDADDLIFNWASSSFEPVSVSGVTGTVAVVPEPATWALFGGGLSAVLMGLRRRGRLSA